MQRIELDFTNCKTIEGLHEMFKETFDFPDYYGRNLDALWDCLTDLSIDEPIHIVIKGIAHWLNQEGYGEYMNKVLKIMDDLHEEYPSITSEVVS